MLTLKQQPTESIGSRIRAEFEECGNGRSAAAFAQHCIDSGFWGRDALATFTLKEATRIVRVALNKKDARGLPFAGETTERDEDGSRVWAMRSFWSLETYGAISRRLRTEGQTLISEADALDAEAFEKFGVFPLTTLAAD